MKNNPSIKKILYASDLGNNTRPVFRFALDLANKYNAEVYMVHVIEPMSSSAKAVISTYVSKDLAEEIQENGMKDVQKAIKKRLKKFCKDEYKTDDSNPAQVTEAIVASGKPSEEILRVAEKHDVDMIVMGKSVKKVLGTKLMGSCARRVSRHAQVPVLVIPNKMA